MPRSLRLELDFYPVDSYPVVSGKSYLIWIAIQLYAGFLSTKLWITIQLKDGWRARLRMIIQIQPEGYPLDRNPVPTGGTGAIRLELDWCPKCFYSWIDIHIVAYLYPVLHRMQCCTGSITVRHTGLHRIQTSSSSALHVQYNCIAVHPYLHSTV